MKQKLQRFMMGRYGNDELNRFMIITTLVLFVLSLITSRLFIGSQIFYIVGIALMVWSYVRMFSRNVTKRYAQNQAFLNVRYKIKAKFTGSKKRFQQRKIYRYYKCPGCRQRVRVPKGKGKICITCPSCKMEFVKRS